MTISDNIDSLDNLHANIYNQSDTRNNMDVLQITS